MKTYAERKAIIEAYEARMVADAQRAAAQHARYLRAQALIQAHTGSMIAMVNAPLLALAAEIRARATEKLSGARK